MKKELLKKLCIFIIFVMLISVVLVQSQIIRTNKKDYSMGDSVYISSSISVNDRLCRANNNTEVNFLIVENQDSWNDGDSLSDVRESSTKIPNSRFSLRKVWDAINPGKYDIIVDCNENSAYDSGEPLYNEGFSVTVKRGKGVISRGIIINDFTWFYDPETEKILIEMLSLKISSIDENVVLKNISIMFSNINQENNSLEIESIEIYDDENSNGKVDDEERIGEETFDSSIDDKQIINIEIESTVNKNENKSLLIVYKISSETEKGNYSLRVDSVTGEGELSKEVIVFSGLPISSNKIIVTEEKTCIGDLILELSSDSVEAGQNVIATLKNVSGCDGKTALIKSDFCYTPATSNLGSCNFSAGYCSVNLKLNKNTTIYSCLDKNNDGDFSDLGESKYSSVTVIKKEVVEEVKGIENKTKEENISSNVSINDTSSVTGRVVEEVKVNEENQIITFI